MSIDRYDVCLCDTCDCHVEKNPEGAYVYYDDLVKVIDAMKSCSTCANTAQSAICTPCEWVPNEKIKKIMEGA